MACFISSSVKSHLSHTQHLDGEIGACPQSVQTLSTASHASNRLSIISFSQRKNHMSGNNTAVCEMWCLQGQLSAEQQSSSKLAKIITELKLERDAAKRQAAAPGLLKLGEMSKPQLRAFWREQHRKVEAKLAAYTFGEDSTDKWRQVGSLLREQAAVGSDASPFTAGTPTHTATSVPTSLSMPANLPTTSLSSSHSKAPALAKKQDGASSGTNYSKPCLLGGRTKAPNLVIREPLDDSSNKQLALQATGTKSVLTGRSIPHPVLPRGSSNIGASMQDAIL